MKLPAKKQMIRLTGSQTHASVSSTIWINPFWKSRDLMFNQNFKSIAILQEMHVRSRLSNRDSKVTDPRNILDYFVNFIVRYYTHSLMLSSVNINVSINKLHISIGNVCILFLWNDSFNKMSIRSSAVHEISWNFYQ